MLRLISLLILVPLTMTADEDSNLTPEEKYLIKTVDNSFPVSQELYERAYSQGFRKVVVRGYEQGRSRNPGGMVDPNYISNLVNAYHAGFRDMDTYWFPCSGKTYNCKSYEDQAAEFTVYNKQNKIPVNRIWLYIEQDSQAHNWDYGSENGGNLAEAMKMVAALTKFQLKAGIYSKPGEWYNIFGDFSVVVNNTLPLWWGGWDDKQKLNDLIPNPKFGGWLFGTGKQYTNVSKSGLFNLNVFLSGY